MIVLKKAVPLDEGMIVTEPLKGSAFTLENGAHQFVVTCVRGGEPVALTGTVSGKFIRANGSTILCGGSISDGKAVVTLNQDCYNIPGRFKLSIINTTDNDSSVIYSCVGEVQRSQEGTVTDTGTVVPTPEQLAQAISDCNTAATAATNASAFIPNVIAPAYSSSATYAVGDYCTKDNYLYRCKTAITTAEAWTAAHWDQVTTGAELNSLNGAVSDVLPYTNFKNSIITNTGYYIGRDGATHPNANFGYSDFIPSVEGMKYVIKAPTYANTGSVISFYASNSLDSFIKGVSLEAGNIDVTIEAPKFTKYIVICYDTRKTFSIYAELLSRERYDADVYKHDLFNGGIVTNADFSEAGYINLDGEIESQTGWYHTPMMSIPEYAEKITIMRSRVISSGYLAAFYTDAAFSAGSLISGYSNSASISDSAPVEIDIPNRARFVSFSTGSTNTEANKKPCAFISSVKMYRRNEVGSVLFSVLGDSYTAYPGWVPDGNDSYYPTNSQTVKDFRKMWWYLLANKAGIQPLVIDGYSGATVSTNVRPEHDVSVAFVNRMKQSMGENRTLSPKPSIIFVMGGQNDRATSTTLGEVKYSDWTDSDLQQFAPAFCYMLDYLIKYNPGCRIINITNTGGVSNNMATAMATACEHYNIENVVLQDIDKSNSHPTDAGMIQICGQVLAIL